jgi:hypothetical protein
MTDATLRTLTKGQHRARAVARAVAGVGIELRFLWNDDTRATQVYSSRVELANAANAKREELLGGRLGFCAAALGDVKMCDGRALARRLEASRP